MKLKAFRIRNYRAIVDTNWVNLSPDNITTLIGQNESGKTTVLEALYSFYTGEFHEDILRSDLSLPYISCSFSVHSTLIDSLIEPHLLKPEVYENFKSSGVIHISRKWTDQKKSVVFFGDDQLISHYEKEEKKDEQAVAELEESVHLILVETSTLTAESLQFQSENRDLERKISNLKKKEVKLLRNIEKATGNRKEHASEEHKNLLKEINELEKKYEIAAEQLNNINTRLNELIIASKYARLFLESGRKYKSIKETLELLNNEIQRKTLELRFCTDDKKAQILKSSIREMDDRARLLNEELFHLKEKFHYDTECLSLALSESKIDNIEEYVATKQKEKRKILTLEELGQLLFKNIPMIDLMHGRLC